MNNKKGNILAIGIMFFLFAMISFVTGLQNPMGIIVKAQFGASNAMSQLGNLANFIAYAFLGLPAGFILKRRGYKFTALAAVAVGFIGVGISYLSGVVESFYVYLLGAFVSGFSMCMLNTVVNPLLNTLGGGGNKGNQLIQLGGSLNSLSATIVPVFVGYLIGDAAKATISDANPALFIAMAIFALAFIIILLSSIPEPELEAAKNATEQTESTGSLIKGALSHRNLVFGIIAIFLYVGVEVGIPNTLNNYLTTKTKTQLTDEIKANDALIAELTVVEAAPAEATQETVAATEETAAPAEEPAAAEVADTTKATEVVEAAPTAPAVANLDSLYKAKKVEVGNKEALVAVLVDENKTNQAKIDNPQYQEGLGKDTGFAGAVVGFYWLLMLVGRLLGGVLGGKVSSRVMMAVVSGTAMVLIALGILLPGATVNFPSVTSELSFAMVEIPLGVMLFVLCGLCTSVMWGATFNLAVEGLGKYTSIASGLFMVMVCGGGVVPFVQGLVADAAGFIPSYWVLVAALAFMLWFALFGSKPKKF